MSSNKHQTVDLFTLLDDGPSGFYQPLLMLHQAFSYEFYFLMNMQITPGTLS